MKPSQKKAKAPNRGQGAIEYLLIIGAAILIVSLVILAATGVFSGGKANNTTAQGRSSSQFNQLLVSVNEISPGEIYSMTVYSDTPYNNMCNGSGMRITQTYTCDCNSTGNGCIETDVGTKTISGGSSATIDTSRMTTSTTMPKVGTLTFVSDAPTTLTLNGHAYATTDPILTGLATLWRMDETSGTTMSDSTGTNNGTLSNASMANQSTAKIGKAYYFNGSNAVTVPSPVSLNNWTAQTISLWINTTGTIGYARIIEKGANNEWTLAFNGDQANKVELQAVNNSQGLIFSPTTLNNGQWHNVVAVLNQNSAFPSTFTETLYIDGVMTGPSTTASINTFSKTNDIYVGRYGVGNYYFTGYIDEIAIWDRSLNAAEVLALYNNTNK